VALLVILPQGARADTGAVQVVEKLQHELLGVMKAAGSLGYEGRYKALSSVIPDLYDFPFISRVVLGRHWGAFSDEEKKHFLDLFTKFSVAIYASRFDGYSGEKFKVISVNESRRDRVVVQTVLLQPSGEKVRMDYVLHRTDGTWRIINVVADGVSDLAMKHAQFGAFLEKNNPEALLELLKTKIAKFSDQGSGEK
jgi:phospholipid transport system substrate-binding protein